MTLSYVALENQLNFLGLDFLIFMTEIVMLVLPLLGWRWRSDEIIYVKHCEKNWGKCKKLLSNLSATLEGNTATI